MTATALDLLDAAIADLEAKLNLAPGESLPSSSNKQSNKKQQQQQPSKKKQPKTNDNNNNNNKRASTKPPPPDPNQPEILKLEFRIGLITKAWVHPKADKLYCEEIDCGEVDDSGQPLKRQIASGLRAHYTLEEMQNRRVLVVANLKPKKLVDFKSHGMVLCAAKTMEDGGEKVEFMEPPEDAPVGEVVKMEGLPEGQSFSPAQVEKKKVFQKCMEDMVTSEEEGVGMWKGHRFVTSKGPVKCVSIRGGAMR